MTVNIIDYLRRTAHGFGWAAATAATLVGVAAAAQSTELARVTARIDAALQTISTTVRAGRVGYATIWDGNKYVQCRRLADQAVRCESAGAAMQPSLHPVLTADRVAALTTLGWTLDPAFGNYVRTFPVATPTAAIAAQIVRALADGYGVHPEDLERATTWVEDVPCPPRNGPTQNLAGIVNDDPTMRRIRTCSFVPEPATPQKVDSAAALVARYGATVTAEIQRLRINAQKRVFVVFDAGIGYVQCLPEPSGAIYCEAQSPDSWPALASVITPERLARLHAAGYADPGRAPNYWKKYAADTDSDAAIAADILTVLYEVYGYDGATPLDIKTE